MPICDLQKKKRQYRPPADFFSAFDTSRPLQMTDIQHGITIMGGREVSRPYRGGFSPKASGFYPFGDAAALSG